MNTRRNVVRKVFTEADYPCIDPVGLTLEEAAEEFKKLRDEINSLYPNKTSATFHYDYKYNYAIDQEEFFLTLQIEELETDEEYQQRLAEEVEAKRILDERAAKIKANMEEQAKLRLQEVEEKDRKEYERLKQKYG